MAMHNPVGRANYEPNSWDAPAAGPRESTDGYTHFAAEESGTMGRARSDSFKDHYSQARQFYLSQTAIEQGHIRDALAFELSKVKTVAIRERTVSHLLHIDKDLASGVATKLGMAKMPDAAVTNGAEIVDLDPSPALSILQNPPASISGRKLGIFAMDGCDMKILDALQNQAKQSGVTVELIAPEVGGFVCSDGMKHEADQKIDGGPSVLYDFVAILGSEQSVERMCAHAPAKDFVSDAFAHCKFIGFSKSVTKLLEAAGLDDLSDEGLYPLAKADNDKKFFEACRALRHWDRESRVFD